MRLSEREISLELRAFSTGSSVHAEPSELLDHARANVRRILADPGREDEGVEALQGGREHAGTETDPVDEIVDRELRLGVGARLQLAHVIADAGEPLQSAVAIKEVLHV